MGKPEFNGNEEKLNNAHRQGMKSNIRPWRLTWYVSKPAKDVIWEMQFAYNLPLPTLLAGMNNAFIYGIPVKDDPALGDYVVELRGDDFVATIQLDPLPTNPYIKPDNVSIDIGRM